jgi:hypothetical protein
MLEAVAGSIDVSRPAFWRAQIACSSASWTRAVLKAEILRVHPRTTALTGLAKFGWPSTA